VRVQVGLEDEHGGHAIHGGGTLGNAEFRLAKQTIGLNRGQALIPKVHRQGKALAEFLGKGRDFFRLPALGAAHPQRVPDDDFADIVVPNGAFEKGEIGSLVLAANGFEALGGYAEGVGHRHADCLGPDIEAENAAVRGVRRLVRNGRGGVLFAGHSYIIGSHIRVSGHAMARKRGEGDPEALHEAAEDESRPQRVVGLPRTQEEADELHRQMRASSSATMVLAVLAVLAIFSFAKLPIIVLLIAILLAFILAPLADLFQRIHLPRSLAALIAVLLFVALMYGIGQVSYNKAVAFSHDLPKYSGRIRSVIGRVRQQAQQFRKTTSSVLPEEEKQEANVPKFTVQQEKDWTEYLSGGLGPTIEIAFAASFIPFLTYFMLSWQDHVRSATVMLFRMKNRNTAYVTLGLISGMIRRFIVGNVLVGLFIGAMSTVIFGFLHLPYFYFIGFISGFLSLVPYLGVLLAAVPPLLSGIGQIGGGGIVAILIAVLGLHLFALNVLYPKFLGSRLQLNPLAVTLSLLFWGWLWGAMGLVLAVPMTAAIKIVFDHIETLRGYGSWLSE
jgi:predicted PurR-regulated permease PerM